MRSRPGVKRGVTLGLLARVPPRGDLHRRHSCDTQRRAAAHPAQSLSYVTRPIVYRFIASIPDRSHRPQEFAEHAERPRPAPVRGAALPALQVASGTPGAIQPRRRGAPCPSGRTAAGRRPSTRERQRESLLRPIDRLARQRPRRAFRAAAACCASATDARRGRATPRRAARDRQTARGPRGRAPSTSRRDRAAAASRDRRASRAARRRLRAWTRRRGTAPTPRPRRARVAAAQRSRSAGPAIRSTSAGMYRPRCVR